jgi:hypothetical protein
VLSPNEELTAKIHRVKFRKWTELEDLREQIVKAAEDIAEGFPNKFYAYLSAALGVEEEEIACLSWIDCVELFYSIHAINLPPSNLPLVSVKAKEKKPVKIGWDYPGRFWYLYANKIAHAYGWTMEYIAELEINDALAMVQEILTDDQLEREFYWGLSEIAYPYNKSTKQNRYQPLERPQWMLPVPEKPKQIRIRRSLLPEGMIINVGDKAT